MQEVEKLHLNCGLLAKVFVMNVQIAVACIVVAVILWKLVHLVLRKWNKYLFKRTNFPELLFSFANCGEHFTAFLNIHR